MGGGGTSRFSDESFLSHSAENFRRRIFYCCNNFGYQKSLDKRGVIKIFHRLFLSHSAEKLRRESFTVATASGMGKLCIKVGSVKIFHLNFLSSQCRNFP